LAVAYDYSGAATTNTVNITVQDGSMVVVSLNGPRMVGGQFEFEVTGFTVGKAVVIQSASSVGVSASWIPVQTNITSSGTITFTTAAAPGIHFFRAVQMPQNLVWNSPWWVDED
jgi:hypothetical protein